MNHFFNRMRIRFRLFLMVAFFLFSFIALGIYCYDLINTVRINGPIYKNIVQGKDLIADILPPPEYIIESFLLVLEINLETDPEKIKYYIERGNELKKEYLSRHEFWINDLEPGNLKKLMVEDAYGYAMQFYDIRDNEYIPAIKAGQFDKAENILQEQLKSFYEKHRLIINKIVEIAIERNKNDEVTAQEFILQRTLTFFIVGFGGIIIILLFWNIISRSILLPLKTIGLKMKDIAEGEGDLTKKLNIESHDELSELSRSFNFFLDYLNQSLLMVKGTSHLFNEISENLILSSHRLADGSSEQSSGVEEIYTTIEEFGHSLDEIKNHIIKQNHLIAESADAVEILFKAIQSMAHNSHALNERIELNLVSAGEGKMRMESSSQEAEKINQSIKNLSEKIRAIESQSESIGMILRVISDITEQTNMLAMNASIEAAHAGEAGKGFSIVANEIRKLSENTNKSTREINILISDIQKGVKSTVEMVEISSEVALKNGTSAHEAALNFENILNNFNEVNATILQITKTTTEQESAARTLLNNTTSLKQYSDEIRCSIEEQAHSSNQLTQSMSMVGRITEDNSVSAQSLQGISENAKERIIQLNSLINRFKLEENS